MPVLHDRAHPALTTDGGAILDESTGKWHTLTPSASTALLHLNHAASLDEAAATYAEYFGIDTSQAISDLTAVRAALTAAGLTDRPRRTRRRR